MEPSIGGSRSSTTARRPQIHPARKDQVSSPHVNPSVGLERAGNGLRRGHSDGQVLTDRPVEGGRAPIVGLGEETWMDFVRHSTVSNSPDTLGRGRMDAARSSMMAADRRRRTSEHHEEYLRRRSSNGVSIACPSINRPNTIFSRPETDDRSGQPLDLISSPPSSRIFDRSLPQRPNIDASTTRMSREIKLPKWQPDAEVSKCPICDNMFSFWYRKHHCRKCGRVVCANCSPHRITIPRQFIVHPPEDAPPSPSTSRNAGVEVIDLTGDNTSTSGTINAQQRPQSSDYRMDPGLGGGQEVRLCNPCVPDPNPLPHLPYQSPRLHTLSSFPRPGVFAVQHDPSGPAPSASTSGLPIQPQRSLSGQHNSAQQYLSNYDGSPSRILQASTDRRHSHAPRPQISPMSPPGYSSTYGSLPDQTAHQVRFIRPIDLRYANTNKEAPGIHS